MPVLVKNDDGAYVFANQAAEALLGYEASEIAGMQIDDLCADDPMWLKSEFARLQSQGVWNGSLVFRHRDGHLIGARLNAFVSATASGRAYISMLHPGSHDSLSRPVPIRTRQGLRLTGEERRILQLLAEGFTDRELAVILGLRDWAMSRDITVLIQKIGVASRTAACVAAMKAHLIV